MAIFARQHCYHPNSFKKFKFQHVYREFWPFLTLVTSCPMTSPWQYTWPIITSENTVVGSLDWNRWLLCDDNFVLTRIDPKNLGLNMNTVNFDPFFHVALFVPVWVHGDPTPNFDFQGRTRSFLKTIQHTSVFLNLLLICNQKINMLRSKFCQLTLMVGKSQFLEHGTQKCHFSSLTLSHVRICPSTW